MQQGDELKKSLLKKLPEVWLRGPLPYVPSLLQPAAHTLLQANEELQERLKHFPAALIWDRPAGVASIAFHLQHITGVLDRLFTYAEGNMLSAVQLGYLEREGIREDTVRLPELLETLDQSVTKAIERLQKISAETLTGVRFVGRQRVPSTTIGLLFHAAEHTMRHTGQALVTAGIIENANGEI